MFDLPIDAKSSFRTTPARCTCPGRIPVLGTLWITQNYLAFSGMLERKVLETMPYDSVFD
jgi:hypothetical protein